MAAVNYHFVKLDWRICCIYMKYASCELLYVYLVLIIRYS